MDNKLVLSQDAKTTGVTINFLTDMFQPLFMFMIGFETMWIKKGLFIFADDAPVNRFISLEKLLKQVVWLIKERIDRHTLLLEIQQSNTKRGEKIKKTEDVSKTTGNRLKRRIDKYLNNGGEEKFQNLFNNVDDAIYLWEINDNNEPESCIEINKAASLITGFKRKELMQLTPFDLVARKDKALLKGFYEKLSQNKHGKISLHHCNKQGKLIPVEVSAHSFTLGNKKVILSIARDITDRKKFENELIRAKNKAEESDRLKSAFLANMSHEIRTPMNAIVGFSNLIQVRDLTKNELKKFSSIIKINSEHLLSLINDIVDISKIEANQVKIVEHEFNLNHMLDDLYLVMLSELNNRENNQVEFTIEKGLKDDDADIMMDEVRLRQILTNLITNAIKFTERGHILVSYTADSQDGLKFAVEDTGIGIPENMQSKIFERFMQVELGSNKTYGGTGLGLAIASRLLELMGGNISVSSKPAEGTTFYFSLPYLPVLKRSQPVIKKNEQKADGTWKGHRVMVAEDDPTSIELFDNIFKGKGLQPLFARNGIEALELFHSTPEIKLIFLDIRLPGKDGITVLKEIRKHNTEIPVIAQTAFAMEEDRNKFINLGFDDYLSKPVSLIQLYGILSKFLN